jgi:hypothetical protein
VSINLSSEPVSLLDEVVGESTGHVEGFVFDQPVFHNQLGEIGAIHTPSYVVAGGDGEKGTRIVIEADRVVEPCCLGCVLTEAKHALGTVMEPPGRAKPQTRIVARKRGKFAAIG